MGAVSAVANSDAMSPEMSEAMPKLSTAPSTGLTWAYLIVMCQFRQHSVLTETRNEYFLLLT